jgi:hypothetical protein
MSDMQIPQRDAIKVFVTERSTISISQERPLDDEPDVIEVHPGDVEQLVNFLQQAKVQAEAALAEEGGDVE